MVPEVGPLAFDRLCTWKVSQRIDRSNIGMDIMCIFMFIPMYVLLMTYPVISFSHDRTNIGAESEVLKAQLEAKERQSALDRQKEKVHQGLISHVDDTNEKIKEEPQETVQLKLSEADFSKFNDSDEELRADSDDSSDSDSNSDSDSDSEDEEELLMRELAKVKAEKEAERIKQEEELQSNIKLQEEADALLNNPLMRSEFDANKSTAVKRRWDDDVVFRNQSRDEQSAKKRYINDTVRSDFHVAFLKKYMK